eukprot:403338112
MEKLFLFSLLLFLSSNLIFISFALLKYYTDPNETVKLALIAQVISFSSVLVYITIIPFDVYSAVNHHQKVLLGFEIYDLYFVDYVIMISLCFVILPFTYFYAEEQLESEDSNDFFQIGQYSDEEAEEEEDEEEEIGVVSETNSTSGSTIIKVQSERKKRKNASIKENVKLIWTRSLKALRNTIIFLALFLVTLIASYLLSQTSFSHENQSSKLLDQWKQQIFDTKQQGEPLLRFILTLFILIGAFVKLLYNSYGMAAMPMLLIRGQMSLEDEKNAINKSIDQVREQLRSIQEKYQRSHEQVSKSDKQKLRKLRQDERTLNVKSSKIQTYLQIREQKLMNSWKIVSKFLKFMTPFRIVMGVFCLCLSLLIVASIVVANLDKFIHSKCGFSCGYFIEEFSLFNPLDWLLVHLSRLFPLDLILIGIILFYVFISCLFGIVRLGIRTFWLNTFHIKKRDTSAQALTLASFFIILMVFAFSMQLLTIAPQYTTFGSQKLKNGQPCGLQQNSTKMTRLKQSDQCEMTAISSFYNKIMLSMPFFGILYFILSWAFVITFFIFLLYHISKKVESNYTLKDYQDDEIQDLKEFISKKSHSNSTTATTRGTVKNQQSDDD